jgi:hypothetical protein
VDPETVARFDPCDRDRIVEIARLFPVDGDRRQVAKVAPVPAHRGGYLLGDDVGLAERGRGEFHGELVLLDDHLGVNAGSPTDDGRFCLPGGLPRIG